MTTEETYVDAPRAAVHLPSAEVRELDPLSDDRWPAFVASQSNSSIFHTREWLEALRRSYGYEPVVYTTSAVGPLEDGVVFCRVRSWLTGKRLVSLPFSDHCQPLASGSAYRSILRYVERLRMHEKLRYAEIRPVQEARAELDEGFGESGITSFQKIDLTPDLNVIYRRFHESCIRRKIKRAERESLVYESGRSEALLAAFRQLMLLTRRRHRLPPQPAAWFRNLVACLGDKIEIHLVSKEAVPVASIITLRHKAQLTYKYGCSDSQFNSVGGTPLLFWKVIQQAKETGVTEFDLGRSDYADPGLIAFKEHLGATTTELRYYRSPQKGPKDAGKARIPIHGWARDAVARLPDVLLEAAGDLLYKHMG